MDDGCIHRRAFAWRRSAPRPALQAKALSLGPGVTLMSEASLAELLGVSDCRLVMDGVAW